MKKIQNKKRKENLNQEENRETNVEESREDGVANDIKSKCESEICKNNDREKIVSHKRSQGQMFYLVKYKDMPEDKNQWEPANNLICNDIITQYWDRIEESINENSNNHQKTSNINESSEKATTTTSTTSTTSTTLKRPREFGEYADENNSRKKEKKIRKQIPFHEFATDEGIWENVVQEIVTVDYELPSSHKEGELIVYVKWYLFKNFYDNNLYLIDDLLCDIF
ncbi:13702_t:CDS:2 [Ambispora leptoticha]|uniref:13702_t:CDS:1 n=1 Tax=Ambispora leptoticha TaxID=144679 RepID=A0A9N9FBV4_9GLOM|nr:13702_t:CDS:2 [Ambispora leptoticha]